MSIYKIRHFRQPIVHLPTLSLLSLASGRTFVLKPRMLHDRAFIGDAQSLSAARSVFAARKSGFLVKSNNSEERICGAVRNLFRRTREHPRSARVSCGGGGLSNFMLSPWQNGIRDPGRHSVNRPEGLPPIFSASFRPTAGKSPAAFSFTSPLTCR